tara:strand:- start:14639 stop:15241 length:603 start_codon:yes stop_codon:yes gene_type:complete
MSHYLNKQRERVEELALVDHPSGLLPWEMLFCQAYADKGQIIDAMRQVCAVHELKNDHSLRMRAVSLLKRPAIGRYMAHLRQRVEDMGIMSKAEALRFVSDIIRTPIDMLDGDNPVCHKKIISETTHRDGTTTTKTSYEKPSGLDAVKVLEKIQGWDAPTKIDVSHSGGVMLVPMTESLSDWEKAAGNSQAKLMADAINI